LHIKNNFIAFKYSRLERTTLDTLTTMSALIHVGFDHIVRVGNQHVLSKIHEKLKIMTATGTATAQGIKLMIRPVQ